MDIKLGKDGSGISMLEYIGGILDFYFFAGSETDPTELARQYAEVSGLPAEVPYWSFGFHQCRSGYKSNFLTFLLSPFMFEHLLFRYWRSCSRYVAAQIPLEAMWTDVGKHSPLFPLFVCLISQRSDYVDRSRIFTVDPNNFPLTRMRELVAHLHSHDQYYGELHYTTTKLTQWLSDSHVQ